jgi:hypothetical protein
MAIQSIKNKTKSGSLLVGNAPYIPSDYESIATVTVGSGGQSTVTFSSIPSTYQHLQLRYIARDTTAAVDVVGVVLRFNSDSNTNYTRHYLLSDGTSVYAGAATSRTSIVGGLVLSGGSIASVFATGVIDILDYANTNKYKTYRVLSGVNTNGTSPPGYVDFESALWLSTSAINSITITLPSGNHAEYSSFALYGIKG